MADDLLAVKQQLYDSCMQYVDERIKASQVAFDEAVTSAAQETKSSAGDKYETGREMLQQETNRYAGQLQEAKKLKHALSQIKANSQPATTIAAGSLVITTGGNFYISIGAGNYIINNTNYYTISPASPISVNMKGLSINDSFTLNKKVYYITAVS